MRLLVIGTAAGVIAGCGSSPSAPEDIKSVIVVGTPPSIGVTTQFTALAVHNDGTTAAVTSHVAWTSSNTAVATVKDDGTVTGVRAGSVEISATASGARGALTFDVLSGPAFRLSGAVTDATSFRRVPGATVVAKDASGESISVVTDTNGNFSIAGIAAGPADVTASANGYLPNTISTQVVGDTSLFFTLGHPSVCPTLGFDDLASQRNNTPFTTWTGCGFIVTATSPIWRVSTSDGRPAPFVQFLSPLGVTTSAELAVTASGGAKFMFQSVDLFSSTTSVVYTITGIGNGTPAFVLQNSVGGAFGTSFTPVRNLAGAPPIDALVIRLTNPGATCCVNAANGMGLDNIVLAR